LPRGQPRALRAIGACRTAALGGHTEACDACGALRIASTSCRNRHCPQCQSLAKERWVTARRAELLPGEYFHVVCTLPHLLNPLAPGNPRVCYALLFQAARETLATLGADLRHLGGEIGGVAILHTWGQTLEQHRHLHCGVPGGALARDGTRWRPAKPGFLFPVRALARVFRGKYLAGLRRMFDRGKRRVAGSGAGLADPTACRQFLTTLRGSDWVVYAKPPFGGPAPVLEYLGRYTHRVALSNDRLLSVADGQVRFRWRDSAHGNRGKTMTLSAEEFLRRFLLHVLPAGFVRIRHFGFLATRGRPGKLAQCRALLAVPPPPPPVGSGLGAPAHGGGHHPGPRLPRGAPANRRCLPAGPDPGSRLGQFMRPPAAGPLSLAPMPRFARRAGRVGPLGSPPARRRGRRAPLFARSTPRPGTPPCPSRLQRPSLGPTARIQSPEPVGPRFSSTRFTRRARPSGRRTMPLGARRIKAYSLGDPEWTEIAPCEPHLLS